MGQQCDMTLNGDFMTCVMPCRDVERMLKGSQFHYFQHDQSERLLIRSRTGYEVPSHVTPHLDFIGGTIRLPSVPKTNPASDGSAGGRERRSNGFHVGRCLLFC